MSNFPSDTHIVNEERKPNWASLTDSKNQMHELDLLANTVHRRPQKFALGSTMLNKVFLLDL